MINPPRIHPKLWGRPSVYQPLDIAYTAAYLEKNHEVKIIDAPGEGWNLLQELNETNYRQGISNEEIANRVRQWQPEIVGITAPFSGWWSSTKEVISAIKGADENSTIVVSGLHPSARPKECLEDPDVDFAIIGEPEQTTLELVNALEQSSKKLETIKGIGFAKKDKVIITDKRPPIEDLDSLPFPARHLLPMATYFSAAHQIPLRGEINKPWAMMITSRGCPYNCVFCTIHNVMGRKWRGRSPQNVIAEIENLVETFGVKQFDFFDDNMMLDKKRGGEICDLIVKEKLKIEWFTPNGVRLTH